MSSKLNIWWVVVTVVAAAALIGLLIKGSFFGSQSNVALELSTIVLVSLVLVVLLMAFLVIVYSTQDLADRTQALGLPEGSIRALIAFSLVVVFVCLTAFLYTTMHGADAGRQLNGITQAQLAEDKAKFDVVYQPAKKPDGSPAFEQTKTTDGKSTDDTTKPLYDATYFVRPSKDADDLAKQIFTTLATIFVSVISFYFGSSATAAGVGKGTPTVPSGAGAPGGGAPGGGAPGGGAPGGGAPGGGASGGGASGGGAPAVVKVADQPLGELIDVQGGISKQKESRPAEQPSTT